MSKVQVEVVKTHIKKFRVILSQQDIEQLIRDHCYGLFGQKDAEVYDQDQSKVKVEIEIARQEYIVEAVATMEFDSKEEC